MKPEQVLNESVLKILGDATGIRDYQQWLACWLLISKSEHDNQDENKTFLAQNGESVFQYADFLPYDWTERGVTCGLVGFTTANDGKPEWGDLEPVLHRLKKKGGPDLLGLTKTCHTNKNDAKKLCKKIHDLSGEDLNRFIESQFEALVNTDGYICETVKAWKHVGIECPSMLAVATVFDTSLNQGFDGKDGGCTNLKKIGKKHQGDENAILKEFNEWRRRVAGKKNYNSCAHNGHCRSDMYESLRKDEHFKLAVDDVKKVLGWKMK